MSALCEVTDDTDGQQFSDNSPSQVLASRQPDGRVKGSAKDKTERKLTHLLRGGDFFVNSG